MTEDDSSFDELQKTVTAALVQVTKTAAQLAKEDLNFVRTSNPDIGKALEKQQSRLLTTIRRISRSAVKDDTVKLPQLSRAEDLDDGWRTLVDIVDNLLENADRCIDEYSGTNVKKVVEPAALSDSPKTKSSYVSREANVPKPQKSFARPPQNNETSPFKPLLQTKPHAVVPLEEAIVLEEHNEERYNMMGHRRGYKHPYEHEIRNYRYPKHVYTTSEPIPSQPHEETTAIWVDTMDGVRAMLEELKQAKEIAIDLEHHEIRSYIGIVSLMQISTREKDWIVDTLKPWREDLQILNEVFADPAIVKVLHGAHMDAIWLQRDLGLYLVGLFDTYHAARSLGYPRASLAFLLQKFVQFEAQKQYQTADWRMRPLSEEMFDYARFDTHFLLYIYDNMRNELLAKANGAQAVVDDVLEESKKEALRRYERTNYDSELGTGDRGWYGLLVRTPAVFNKEQFAVFRAVHQWRDQIARKDDESPSYLIGNTTIFNIARDIPASLATLQGHFSRRVDSVSSRLSDLLRVIQEAKTAGQEGPDMNEFMASHPLLPEYHARKVAKKDFFRAQAAQQHDSVAAILQQELRLSGQELKCATSAFWGGSVRYQSKQQPPIEEEQPILPTFQVPLPQLTAEVFSVNGEEQDQPSTPVPLPKHVFVQKPTAEIEDGEEVFTLREKGGPRKRKRKDVQDKEDPMQDDDLSAENGYLSTGETPENTKSKSKRKSSKKKKKKREERLAAMASQYGQMLNEDNEMKLDAFDYANAPSVLNGQQDPSSNKKDKKRSPVLNPYAKSMNAPKGLPKKKEIQGKSATFKN